MAAQDGPVRHLFDNTGTLYYGHGFEMLAVWCKPGWPKKLVNVTFYKFLDITFYKYLRRLLVKTRNRKQLL